MTDDERAIRTVADTWIQATKTGDTATVLSLMADDVVFMVAGRPPFGKAEFADMSKAMAWFKLDGGNEIKELHVTGDWAYVRGYVTMLVTAPDGQRHQRSGPTLSIFRKLSSGHWVLARDANLTT